MRRTRFQNPATVTCLLLFATLFLAGSYFRQVVEYDNSSSRFYLLSAIVDHSTFSIDAYHEQTIDKSFHDGHYYSNKAFGSSFVAVPIYWALRTLPLTRGDAALTVPQRQMVNMATSTVCFAGLGVLLYLLGMRLGGDARSALLMAFAFSFGSIAWVHATMFSGHIMAAAFSFLAFAVLWWLRRQVAEPPQNADRQRLHLLLALAAGLAAGVGALCDYTAMFIALVLAIYALTSRLSWLQKASFALGGALCASQLLIYNWMNFGAPFSLSYGHLAREEFAEGASQGLLGVGLPSPSVLWQLLASPSRGLLFIMPVFLFAVAGLVVMWRKRRDLRAEWWVVTSVSVGTLLINAGFYGWHGGWAHGPRYLVPMFPFLLLPMVFAPLRGWPFGLALVASVAQVVPGVAAFAYTPQNIINPLRDMVLPLMSHGYLAENGLYWLGASKTLGAAVGLAAMAVLSVLTWRTLRDSPWQTTAPTSRPLAAVVAISLLSIAAATVTMKTERELRLRVMSRLAYDAELPLPYKDAQDFMENAP
ncbi:MAG: phospholipid carrier-dependent glycosyltransferase [Acidobacteria bacterium]|nr:MAG: phospholipid carrier-dependent glycosyltransferase [Acidobacteriota bacterium]